jgi:hypothetical protein
MKDMFTGLPKDVQAQIRRDAGVVAAQTAVSLARRKAVHAFVLDIALMYAATRPCRAPSITGAATSRWMT